MVDPLGLGRNRSLFFHYPASRMGNFVEHRRGNFKSPGRAVQEKFLGDSKEWLIISR
jgi:hypothetical protein